MLNKFFNLLNIHWAECSVTSTVGVLLLHIYTDIPAFLSVVSGIAMAATAIFVAIIKGIEAYDKVFRKNVEKPKKPNT